MWCRCFAKPKKRTCLSRLNTSEKVAWEEITGLLNKRIEPQLKLISAAEEKERELQIEELDAKTKPALVEKVVADALLNILDNKDDQEGYEFLIAQLKKSPTAMKILSERGDFGLGQVFKNRLGELKPDNSGPRKLPYQR